MIKLELNLELMFASAHIVIEFKLVSTMKLVTVKWTEMEEHLHAGSV